MLALLTLTILPLLSLVLAAPVDERAEAATKPTPTHGAWPAFFTGTTLHPYDKRGNILRHKCLDVAGQVYADGTHVQIWDCNGTPAQKWDLGYGSVNKIWAHRAPGLGFCLDSTTPTPGDGTKLVIKGCGHYEEHHDTQMWHYGANYNGIQFAGNEWDWRKGAPPCVDVTDGQMWNGNQMQTWSCHKNVWHPDFYNQQFYPGAML